MEGDVNRHAIENMLVMAKDSHNVLRDAQLHLTKAIEIGEIEGTPYKQGFASVAPHQLAALWGGSIIPGQHETVTKIASEIKKDHLAPTHRFVEMLMRIESLTDPVITSFQALQVHGVEGRLRESLEKNEVPLQADFALLMTTWMDFLREYIADSLVATHVAFEAEGYPALMAS